MDTRPTPELVTQGGTQAIGITKKANGNYLVTLEEPIHGYGTGLTWEFTPGGLYCGFEKDRGHEYHLTKPIEITAGELRERAKELDRRWDEAKEAVDSIPSPSVGLPTDAVERKGVPIFSGVLKYFPDAVAMVARLSKVGNEQHNPGKPLFWDRSKSGDELDALSRHLIDAGTDDTDGIPHSAKVAWRALANLQKELESKAS